MFYTWQDFLLEGKRKKFIQNKYPWIPNSVLKWFSAEDPSGRNKYLEWLANRFNNQIKGSAPHINLGMN